MQMYPGVLSVVTPLFLLAASAASSEATHSSAQDAAGEVHDGIAAAARGDVQQAMADYQSALRLDPENAEANYRLGRLLGESGDFPGAAAAFRRAIQSKPGFAEAHYDLGLTFVADTRGKVDWQSAIAEFRIASQLRPDYPDALKMLGVGLLNLGDTNSAIETFRRALGLGENSPEIHFNLGSALENAEQPTAAETEYKAALQSKPVYPAAEVALGKLLSKEGKKSEAMTHLRAALHADPDLASAHYVLATVLRSQGQSEAANIEFLQAAQLTQRAGIAVRSSRLSNEGLELAAKGNFTGAVTSLREAIELKPDYAIAHFNTGLLLADCADFSGASKEIVKAISLHPSEPRFYLSLARVLERTGDVNGARDAIERAARLAPSDPAIAEKLQSLQRIALQKGQSDVRSSIGGNQEDLYRYGANANTPAAHFAYGAELKKAGDVTGEIGELLRSLELEPNFVQARLALALDYLQLGKIDKAASEFYKLLDVCSECAEAHFGLGQIALEERDPATATVELRSALRLKPDYPEAAALLERAIKTQKSESN